jgi:hypothetical protein
MAIVKYANASSKTRCQSNIGQQSPNIRKRMFDGEIRPCVLKWKLTLILGALHDNNSTWANSYKSN